MSQYASPNTYDETNIREERVEWSQAYRIMYVKNANTQTHTKHQTPCGGSSYRMSQYGTTTELRHALAMNTPMHHLAAEPLPPAPSSTMKPNKTHAVDRSTFFKSMASRIKASRDAIKQSGNQQNDWSRWTSDMPNPAIQDSPRRCDILPFDATLSSPASTSMSTTVASDTTSEHTSETDVHSDANSLGADVHHDPAITYYLIGLVGNELRDRIANKLCEVEAKMRWEFDASVASSGAVNDDMDVSSLAGRQQSAHSFRRSLLRRSSACSRSLASI